jgi:hypothetical protein
MFSFPYFFFFLKKKHIKVFDSLFAQMAFDRPLVIALNGPPGVGKDTLAEALLSEHPNLFNQLSIKAPLLNMAYKDPIYGHVIAHAWAPGAEYGLKDMPVLLANGDVMTPRTMLINIATHIRHEYGDGYFARKAAEKIVEMGSKRIIIITDIGFECERRELEVCCDVILVRIERVGHTFQNDSRAYLPMRGLYFALSNNTSIDLLKEQFCTKLGSMLC